MRNEAFSLSEAKVQITGIARIAEKTGLFLLLISALVVMVTWLSFAARAQTEALQIEAQALEKQAFLLKKENIALLEQVTEACFLADVTGFYRSRNWEVLARGP